MTPDRPEPDVRDVTSAAVRRMAASGRALRRRGGTSAHATGRSRRVAGALAVAYAVAVVLIGFWGTPVDSRAQPWIDRLIGAAHRHGAPSWFGYPMIESLANVAFFVPLGLLVVLLAGARWWWAGAAAGLLVSATIETGQALFLPARFATVDDVVANTMGAVLGAVLGVVLLAAAARRRRG
ncbi:VanZ family protein [Curtobacterium sp. MCPF17_011]|uniref:VanZ family protein n=1 Tax=Curtobacterium sp. MCPF17_011 TaxID=2175652 RepID=UPI000DA742AC|nr:VanZ family protein [Curtobacterium sp. MCPF17_011]PZF11056.1 VanZ family protein [Curtobacterium sp. MCPF17_011]